MIDPFKNIVRTELDKSYQGGFTLFKNKCNKRSKHRIKRNFQNATSAHCKHYLLGVV